LPLEATLEAADTLTPHTITEVTALNKAFLRPFFLTHLSSVA
jgi:hypothetical protein